MPQSPPHHASECQGARQRALADSNPALLNALAALVEPTTRSDPQSPLRWTCKSASKLTTELNAQGYAVSPQTVDTLLRRLDYSLQSLRKIREGGQHPDSNAQFEHINAQVRSFQEAE